MEWFRSWLIGVMSAALILAMIYALVPKGTIRTIAQFTCGLILTLAILQPIVQWDPDSLKVQYEEYATQIDEQIDTYKADRQKELRAIIEEETAAYISDKGLSLGIDCHPVVKTQLRDEVPYPNEVTLDTDWNKDLSDYITQELDISPQNQYWQGSN